MRKFLILAFIFLINFFSVSAQKGYKVFAVGFYNVENLFHPENDSTKDDDDFTPEGDYHYTQEVYEQKLHNIATVFQQLGTDVTPAGAAIIGMAEVENNKVLTDLVNQPEIKDRNYQFVWFPTSDVRGISTALLYNPKYFRVINAVALHVPLESVGQSRPTRNVLYVKGVAAGNDTLHIMVNHWPSRGGGVAETSPYRQVAAAVDKHIADSLLAINPNTKIIIMGDLNDNPTDASVIKVLQAQADTINVTLADIYNPWINIYKKGIGTEIYDGQWNLLDQIMISGAFLKNNNNKWRYYKNRIFNKDFLAHQSGIEKGLPHRSFTAEHVWDNGYSDHFPVLVYLVQ